MAGLEGIEPLRKEGTAVLIANMLREQLAQGHLEPGEPLGEAQLAEQLEVSRAPVREALQRLAQEGLLDGQYHRRWTVARIDEAEIRDAYFARGVVERAAAQQVAGDPPADMYEILDEMRKAALDGDWNAISAADMRFHVALVRGSGSKRLERMFSTLSVEASMCLRALKVSYHDYERIVTEHDEVLRALEDPDPAVGRARIDLHLERAVERLTASRAGAEQA